MGTGRVMWAPLCLLLLLGEHNLSTAAVAPPERKPASVTEARGKVRSDTWAGKAGPRRRPDHLATLLPPKAQPAGAPPYGTSPYVIQSTTTVLPRDMHSNVRETVTVQTENETGKSLTSTSRILELADGLNYRDAAGTWQATKAEFERTPAGFVARFGPHKAILKRILEADAVDLETPDGIRLVSAPLALAYFDPASGGSATLSTARPVQAEWLAPNQALAAGARGGREPA
ncbi:MAG: hypothetical protein FJ387_21845 [Verrucomicrobia bacterium]|nr:hypothetical protein [Verrucomicrobiota bacterium]